MLKKVAKSKHLKATRKKSERIERCKGDQLSQKELLQPEHGRRRYGSYGISWFAVARIPAALLVFVPLVLLFPSIEKLPNLEGNL